MESHSPQAPVAAATVPSERKYLPWRYEITTRVEAALAQRKIDYEFNTSTFWLWNILGSLILIGPYVYTYKLCHAMNLLCADYNERPILE